MIVAVAEVRVRLPLAASLKDRRRALDGALQRMRARFPIAVAQVELGDDPHWATLGIAAVAGGRRQAEALRDEALRHLERLLDGEGVELVEIRRDTL
ncbi:MAG: DUF503 domain-containing protein [Clostridia bacterium]|nr:DUF503 domain-containing protein [Clostridia bacterium]